MFFSKVWVLILSFVSVLAIGSLLVATRPAEFFLQQAYKDRVVDLFQAAFDKELEWESRQVLDSLARVRMDGRITDIFEKKSDPHNFKDAFKKFSDMLNTDELIIANNDGKVLLTTVKGRESIAGMMGFMEAKKGFHNDNTVISGDDMYMTWAVPIISTDRKSNHGVLMGMRKVDAEFLSYHLGRMGYGDAEKRPVQLSVFNGKKVMHTTADLETAEKLPEIYKKHIKDLRNPAKGFSPVELVKGRKDNYAVILGMLRGAATNPLLTAGKDVPELPDTGVYYAVSWKLPRKMGALAFLDKLIPQNELLKGFPWGLFIGATILLLFLGIFFILWEGDLPLRKLIAKTKEVASGEMLLINDQDFGGRYSSLARAINEALEKIQSTAKPDIKDKSVDELLSAEASAGGDRPGLKEGGPPPPPVTGKPLVYPKMKDVALPGQREGSSSSRPALPPIPSKSAEHVQVKPPVEEELNDVEIDEPQPPKPGDDSSEYFTFITEKYSDLKMKLDGNLDGFKADDFMKKLGESTEAIRTKAKCEQVSFEVYERDGKPGLKGVPKRK